MPKVTLPSTPLNGLFAISKPSGPPSMVLLDRLKALFSESTLFVSEEEAKKARDGGGKGKGKGRKAHKGGAIKMGQGGTLDPLADGILVIGIGKGTKSLSQFLNCTKEYRTTCLLGCETDSYDSEGAIVRMAPWSHVTKQSVENVLDRFRGDISQLPPLYSALKMEGKPLYEYARSGTPLPQPIQARPAKVHSLELVDWIEGKPNDAGSSSEAGDTAPRRPGHTFKWPAKVLGTKELEELDKVRRLVREAAPEEVKPEIPPLDPAATPATQSEPQIPPVFTLTMTVSSGTYVRSIVHDIGLAVGSAAHVVVLTRTRQGEFALEKGNYVAWDLFEKAMEARKEGGEVVRDEDGREDWERAVLDKWQSVDSLNKVD